MGHYEIPKNPVFVETVDGEWLAIAPPGAAVRVGAWGHDQKEAGLRFDEARALLERCLRSAG